MNLNDFRYVVQIADDRSYNIAAKKLFVTQPALSQRIKAIEKQYDISLFIRTKQGVLLTPQGEIFTKYAREILRQQKCLHDEILAFKEKTQTIRLGLSWIVDSPYFRNQIMRFCVNHPGVAFEFTQASSSELKKLVEQNKLDMAICYMPVYSRELVFENIFKDTYVFVPACGSDTDFTLESSGIEIGGIIPPEILNGEPIAVAPPDTKIWSYVSAVKEAEQVHPNIVHTISSLAMMTALAEEGVASAILFESQVRGNENLRYYILDSDVDRYIDVAVTWKKNSFYAHYAKELARKLKSISI